MLTSSSACSQSSRVVGHNKDMKCIKMWGKTTWIKYLVTAFSLPSRMWHEDISDPSVTASVVECTWVLIVDNYAEVDFGICRQS